MSFGTKDFRVPPHRWIIIQSQIEINRDNTSRCTKLLFIDTNLELKYDWCTFGMVQLWICDSFNATWGGDTGAFLHFLCTSIEKASVYGKLSYKTIFITGYCNFNLHFLCTKSRTTSPAYRPDFLCVLQSHLKIYNKQNTNNSIYQITFINSIYYTIFTRIQLIL